MMFSKLRQTHVHFDGTQQIGPCLSDHAQCDQGELAFVLKVRK